jgi:hypothetical protein
VSLLEDLKPNASVQGVLLNGLVTVVSVQWHGSEALELTYKTPEGKVANELLYRHDEPRVEVVQEGRPWSFDGDGKLFRLVSEAQRIRLAHLFDPVLAVHTSIVEPLPHPASLPKRFHGTVGLDPTRVGRDAGRVADEVIAHVASLVGSEVTVTLEIEAKIPSGVPDKVVRTVTENSRTLKFTSQGFEQE